MLNTNYVLIGENGVISSTLKQYLKKDTLVVSSAMVRTWVRRTLNTRAVINYLNLSKFGRSTILYCVGDTNPQSSDESLKWINYELPKLILDSIESSNARLVTFGSTLEAQFGRTENRYLQSKSLFTDHLLSGDYFQKNIHLQLNTIYGGLRNPAHMLLGQLENALRRNENLLVSSGDQLREYHHIEDDAKVILSLISDENIGGIFPINHGQSIRIKDMLKGVMKNLGFEGLLKLGSLPNPKYDNYDFRAAPTSFTQGFSFREPILGITNYLRERLKKE